MYKLSLPAARSKQLLINLFEPFGEDRLQELVSDLADRLLSVPSVQFLGAAIPVGDHVVHIAHEDRIVREVKEASLLAQHFKRLAHFGHQASNDQRRSQKGN